MELRKIPSTTLIGCSTFLNISGNLVPVSEPESESSTRAVGETTPALCPPLVLPTSDFEEAEESDEDKDKLEQIITLEIESESGESKRVHLVVNRGGVQKVTQEFIDVHLVSLTRTTVPIIFGQPSKFQEKKAEIEKINNSISLVGPDLVAVGAGAVVSKVSQDVEQTPVNTNNKQLKRSLSPVFYHVSPKKTGVELKRQLTFVETSCRKNNRNGKDDIVKSNSVKLIESDTQTDEKDLKHIDSQTDAPPSEPEKDVSMLGTQTIPVAMSQVSVQTDPSFVVEDVIKDQIVTVPRTPRQEITFSTTQTTPRTAGISATQTTPRSTDKSRSVHMTSQTSPQISSRTRESSPSSCITASQPQHPVMMTEDAAADEMVCRVLLEHAGSDSDRDIKSAISDSSTIPDDSDRSVSFMSGDLDRATSFDDNHDKKGKDLSRTVNYLDLSRLGNEGETPNSDEIWVTVEDDNKFLTSDTETYSVATDKVSTMATFKGHAVGSGFAENVALFNSASEAELAELGNESLASDLEGQDFTLQNFGNLLHHEMEPIRTRLDSTGRTVSGIAETLYHIQVKLFGSF